MVQFTASTRGTRIRLNSRGKLNANEIINSTRLFASPSRHRSAYLVELSCWFICDGRHSFQGKGELFTYFLVGDSQVESPRRLSFDAPARSMAAFTSCPADVGRTWSRESSPAQRKPRVADNLLTRVVSNAVERSVLRSPLTDVTFV